MTELQDWTPRPPRSRDEEQQDVVTWFAGQMIAKLRKNSWKGSWDSLTLSWLLHRMRQELGELRRAVQAGDFDAVIREAADVANFALMVADNARRALYDDAHDEGDETP